MGLQGARYERLVSHRTEFARLPRLLTRLGKRYGAYSTVDAIKAGLDLEMPGPAKLRGEQLRIAINSHKLHEGHIDARVRDVLNFVKYCAGSGIPENAHEGSANTPETAAFLRSLGSSSIVLMKNDDNILPFSKEKTVSLLYALQTRNRLTSTKIAVIGPLAKSAAFCGGGSASLRPFYTVTPLDGIKGQATKVQYTMGAAARKMLPTLGPLLRTSDGKQGFSLKFYLEAHDQPKRELIDELHLQEPNFTLVDYENAKIKDGLFYADIEGELTPDEGGLWDFGITVSGTAQLFIDGKLVVDNKTKQTQGESFFGAGTVEETGSIELEVGKKYSLQVQFGSAPTAVFKRSTGLAPLPGGGLIFGGARHTSPEEELERAVKLAKEVDQVIICTGLGVSHLLNSYINMSFSIMLTTPQAEFESEGYDRTHMDLPAGSDLLISRVAEANPNTVVVVQSGTPVTMPWAPKVKAVLQAWYGGNECGNSIADVIFGEYNPSAKLPLTMPVRCEDNPAFFNFRSDNGRALYGEDIFVGYRYYEKISRPPLFAFGHGLSYTTFEMSDLKVEVDTTSSNIKASVQVRNTGDREGEEVVQVYVSQKAPTVTRAVKELKTFAKVKLQPGKSDTVSVEMTAHDALSFWNELTEQWVIEDGTYTVHVGNSSASTPLKEDFVIDGST